MCIFQNRTARLSHFLTQLGNKIGSVLGSINPQNRSVFNKLPDNFWPFFQNVCIRHKQSSSNDIR